MYELVINFLFNYFVKKEKENKIFMDLIVLYFVLNKYFN